MRSNTFNKTNNPDKKKRKIYHKISYIKGDKIGEGRFSEIYSGLCISNGEIITIKYFKNLSEEQKNRIINKLNVLYKLDHKNIIRAINVSDGDVYDEKGNFRILYESLKLKNVEKLIEEYGGLDEKIIQMYIKQLLEGLKYLHENNVYHKNIKPSNILVDNDGTIKISDWLVDSLILGSAEEIYNKLLESDTIDYYIPPFFIKAIINFKEEKSNETNRERQSSHKNKMIFNDWRSYDLWCLGCLIVEVYSRKKPWSHYSFKNNEEFFDFLNKNHLIPTIPKKLSKNCQDLIKLLFDYESTKDPGIYETIFNLDFFKGEKNDLNDSSQAHFGQSEDSNANMSNNLNSESGMLLGQILQKNKVVNILNGNNNESFSVSYTAEENSSMAQSLNKLKQSQTTLLNMSESSRGNIIRNKNKFDINMPKVYEADPNNEQSPDAIKQDGNNFIFNK
jgi:serine/threonine protein kinase